MFLRKYWLPMSVFIVMIVGVGLYYLQTRPPKPPIIIYKTTEVETPKAKAPVAETPQGGHFHQEVETPQGGHFHQHGSGLAEPPPNRANIHQNPPLRSPTNLQEHKMESRRPLGNRPKKIKRKQLRGIISKWGLTRLLKAIPT